MSSSSSSGAIFSGNSRYSADFAAIIERSVAIASLPISQLNDQVDALNGQAGAVGVLQQSFTSLQSAIGNLETAVSGSSFDAIVSDENLVAVTVGDGAMEGVYSIEVLDIGAYSTSMSTAAWVGSSGSGTYTLTVGEEEFTIETANRQAATVAATINSVAGDAVRATVVNVGSSQTPDYRIVLQSTRLGDFDLQLTRGGAGLQTQQTAGREAGYIVNDSGIVVNSSSRTVEIAEGVGFELLESEPGVQVDVTLTRSSSALGDALSAFAAAFNDAVDAVDAHRGTAAGALSGQAAVLDMSSALRGLATYAGAGAVSGLSSLGLALGRDGKLTFNEFSFIAADISNSSGISSFLGSTTAGGFLKAAYDAVNDVEGGGGLLEALGLSFEDQVADLESEIAGQRETVNLLEERLVVQMAAADSLIAALEQQYSYLASMFESMRTAANQYS